MNCGCSFLDLIHKRSVEVSSCMLNSLQKFLVLDLVQSLFSARQRSCLSISSCNYVSGPAQGERLPGRCVAMETRCVTWAFGSHCSVSAVSPCLHGYVSEACVTVLYGELAKRHVAPLPAADKHCRIHLSTKIGRASCRERV